MENYLSSRIEKNLVPSGLIELKNQLLVLENGDLVEKLLKNPNVSRLRKSIIDMN
jgi:hypothetical protein